jgi:hypothetical protein
LDMLVKFIQVCTENGKQFLECSVYLSKFLPGFELFGVSKVEKKAAENCIVSAQHASLITQTLSP